MQIPLPPHCGSMHCVVGTSHSVPFQPLKHRQRPLEYCPLPLHRTGQAAVKQNTTPPSAAASFQRKASAGASRLSASSPLSLLSWSSPELLAFQWLIYLGLRKNNWTRIPLEQSGPRNPGKQWQVPETHSPFPWQFRGHSTTDSEAKRKDKRLLCRLSLAQGQPQGQRWPFDHCGYMLREVGLASSITKTGFLTLDDSNSESRSCRSTGRCA